MTGTNQTPYGFTGEPLDNNGLLYLRARYYAPGLGVFTALDPFEGTAGRPMSLNGYSWVEGSVPNAVDSSGKSACLDIPALQPGTPTPGRVIALLQQVVLAARILFLKFAASLK